jgi:hypothetical protein
MRQPRAPGDRHGQTRSTPCTLRSWWWCRGIRHVSNDEHAAACCRMLVIAGGTALLQRCSAGAQLSGHYDASMKRSQRVTASSLPRSCTLSSFGSSTGYVQRKVRTTKEGLAYRFIRENLWRTWVCS